MQDYQLEKVRGHNDLYEAQLHSPEQISNALNRQSVSDLVLGVQNNVKDQSLDLLARLTDLP